MFCTGCGAKLDDTANFCTVCGKATLSPPAIPPAAAFAPAAVRKLRRIRSGKKIAGICLGFADYFAMDVTLMRLIWLGLVLIPPNVGLLAYPVCWIVLPVVETANEQ